MSRAKARVYNNGYVKRQPRVKGLRSSGEQLNNYWAQKQSAALHQARRSALTLDAN